MTVHYRLWSKIGMGENGCWEWLGNKNDNGYGLLKVNGKQLRVHRLTYNEVIGPIPEGLMPDHLCRNRGCVNPFHLEPVTNKINVMRGSGLTAQNAQKTHCPSGHPYIYENLYIHNSQRHCKICRKLRDRSRCRKKRAFALAIWQMEQSNNGQ